VVALPAVALLMLGGLAWRLMCCISVMMIFYHMDFIYYSYVCHFVSMFYTNF
jgi:hypothetical protein